MQPCGYRHAFAPDAQATPARAQALGAPVEVDISKLEPGSMVKVEWRGKPVWTSKPTYRPTSRSSMPTSR